MSKDRTKSGCLLQFLIALILIGLFVFVGITSDRPQSRRSRLNGIINNLRIIDGAKNQWAYEHVTTNYDQILKLTNRLSAQDLRPYLGHFNNENGFVKSVANEIYVINALNKSPEAKLVDKIDKPWPSGSIISFSGIEKVNSYMEITFPDGTRTNF